MPDSPVLADASVWISYFRQPSSHEADRLADLLQSGSIRICGQIAAEILQGSRNEEEFHFLNSALKAVEYLGESQEDWESAALTVSQLRKKGISMTLSDSLIAAIAHRLHCLIFTLDRDFSKIPHVRLFR